MYYKAFYHTLDEQKIAKEISAEGFHPIKITDDPGYLYPPHSHPETKLLVFLKGNMEVVRPSLLSQAIPNMRRVSARLDANFYGLKN